jgi:hypothetical protein
MAAAIAALARRSAHNKKAVKGGLEKVVHFHP